ncbi:MAG: thiol:disulfide interchange protein [Rhodothermaceae bacterium]|nr:thiol:disulfide interchange protein [Rhodothermaceae bacterium]MXZ17466.1 thiol:disulfide interchange protein [Rhodothermaceae bacterium]MYG69792.1 thiol:disulfide interchange protein [Rhodothermaceae bacterium]MYJ21420.1 thiol:disulfide interchange protein [Rhodothermaceae bacterium]MYJ44783.1 thiol:disulfide interchange protein [Rhodothermaceae bacterium]
MTMNFRLVWAAVCGMFICNASTYGQTDDTSPYSEAALVSESEWIAPGTGFTVGLTLTMDEGWHSYWINPGDVGEPIILTWDLPVGFSAGPIQWPYPEKIDAGPLRSYGYSDAVTFLVAIMPPEGPPEASVTLSTTADWLICEDVCLFAKETVSLSLPVRESLPAPGPHFEEIAAARAKLPVKDPAWTVEASHYSNSFALRVSPPTGAAQDLEGAYFFPAQIMLLEHAVDQPMSRDGDAFVFALQQSKYATELPDRLQGVLVAREGQYLDAARTVKALEINVPLRTAADQNTGSTLPILILFALIGGLLLNLMPCVFPVLSIKLLSFAQHNKLDRATRTWHGASFAAGVVVSFLVLAGLLFALRATGSQIGWGFQLQSPLFVAGMAFLFLAIGLNLFGVFDIRGFSFRGLSQSSASHSLMRSCLDGALATLVATPCTAPFMGAALGAAVVLPTAQALTIFVFLGLGMAAPYVILSMFPVLLDKLPRPGPWMETLKHVLAFPILGTTVWLAWIFGNQVGVNGLGLLLLGLLLFAAAVWILGWWPSVRVTSSVRNVTRGIALVIACVGIWSAYQGAQQESMSQADATPDSHWSDYSTEKVQQLSSEGRPVFVDFTATWCLTCQVNKKTTLSSSTLLSAFAQKGVVLMRADWTSRDAEITRALESHGRSGVPLYVLYPGNNDSPVLLPEVLTESIVLNALASLPNRAEALKTTISTET